MADPDRPHLMDADEEEEEEGMDDDSDFEDEQAREETGLPTCTVSRRRRLDRQPCSPRPTSCLQPAILAARGQGPQGRVPLHHFLRLIAGGGRMMEHAPAASNDELVASLKRSGVISRLGAGGLAGQRCRYAQAAMRSARPCHATHVSPPRRSLPSRPPRPCSDRVHRALKLCARDLFVPAAHRNEALIDVPIR